jgi:phage terminase large subunit-like protein
VNWLAGGLLTPRKEGGLRLRKGLYVGLLGLAFLLLYVIDPAVDDWVADIPRMLLPLLALSAVCLLFLSEDPLQYSRSGSNRHIAFFQAQFPRVYIQQQYNLTAPEARQRWLTVLRQWRDENHPKHFYFTALLRRRLECRLVFYLQRVLVWLSFLSFMALVALAVLSSWQAIDLPGFYSLDNTGLTAARVAFPFVLLGLYVYLRVANRPDRVNPTGAWLRWKEINDQLKDWWDQNEGAPLQNR